MTGVADRAAAMLARGRAMANELMLDELTFGHMAPGDDPDTGLEVDTFTADWTSPGQVTGGSRGADQVVRTVTIGGVERSVIAGGLKIPADRPETVKAGVYVKVTGLAPMSPTHLLGRLYRIEGESTTSHETARRFDVVEVN